MGQRNDRTIHAESHKTDTDRKRGETELAPRGAEVSAMGLGQLGDADWATPIGRRRLGDAIWATGQLGDGKTGPDRGLAARIEG